MKMLILALCLIGVTVAAPAGCTGVDPKMAALRAQPALQFDDVRDEHGQYAYRYVTAEGTIVSQRGRLVPNPDGCGEVLVVDGETSYIGDDGKTYNTKYSAGLDGNHVQSAQLSVPAGADIARNCDSQNKNPCVNVVTVAPARKENPCAEVVTSACASKKNPCVHDRDCGSCTERKSVEKKKCAEDVTTRLAPKKNRVRNRIGVHEFIDDCSIK